MIIDVAMPISMAAPASSALAIPVPLLESQPARSPTSANANRYSTERRLIIVFFYAL